MADNNVNQNPSLPENRAKSPVRGFPGMKAELASKAQGRSAEEVKEARLANAAAPIEDGEDPEDQPASLAERHPKDGRRLR